MQHSQALINIKVSNCGQSSSGDTKEKATRDKRYAISFDPCRSFAEAFCAAHGYYCGGLHSTVLGWRSNERVSRLKRLPDCLRALGNSATWQIMIANASEKVGPLLAYMLKTHTLKYQYPDRLHVRYSCDSAYHPGENAGCAKVYPNLVRVSHISELRTKRGCNESQRVGLPATLRIQDAKKLIRRGLEFRASKSRNPEVFSTTYICAYYLCAYITCMKSELPSTLE